MYAFESQLIDFLLVSLQTGENFLKFDCCLAYSANTLSDVIFAVLPSLGDPDQKYFRTSISRPGGLDKAKKPSHATVPLTVLRPTVELAI